MDNTKYVYAVSNIRCLENKLLSDSFFDALADAPDYKSAIRILKDKKIISEEKKESIYDIEDALNESLKKEWEHIKEIIPSKNEVDFLIVKNDFHNLKAIIKSIFINQNPKQYYIFPSLIDTDFLYKKIKEKNFSELPLWISEIAEKSYEILFSTNDGQISDFYIDKHALITMLDFAKKTKNEFSILICENDIAIKNIKTAFRLSDFNKNDLFYSYAFSPCEKIDINLLKNACQKGKDAIIKYLKHTDFSDFISYEDMENYSYNNNDYKNITFGIEPIISYYINYENQIKVLKKILISKS